MSPVRNKHRTYSEKWDTMLNHILDEGGVTGLSSELITFKVFTGRTNKPWWGLGFIEQPIFKFYKVWIANRETHYGTLFMVDDYEVSTREERAASQETMNKLAKVEDSFLNKNLYDF